MSKDKKSFYTNFITLINFFKQKLIFGGSTPSELPKLKFDKLNQNKTATVNKNDKLNNKNYVETIDIDYNKTVSKSKSKISKYFKK